MQRNFSSWLTRASLWPLLLLLFIAASGRPAGATVSLMVEAPQSVVARQDCQFVVVGDQLHHIVLRFFALQGTTGGGKRARQGAPRILAYSQRIVSAVPLSNMNFDVRLPAPGLYQAEAAAYDGKIGEGNPATATDDVTITCQAATVTVPSLDLEAPDDVSPPGKVSFRSTGALLHTAILKVWKLHPTGGESLCFTQRGYMPPLPRTEKEQETYDPAIKWSVTLPPGVYLAEARSGALQQLHTFHVNDLGLLAKRSPHGLMVYAVRLSTGQPCPGVAVRVDDHGYYVDVTDNNGNTTSVLKRPAGPSRGAFTGPDGIVEFPETPDTGSLWLCAGAGDGSRVQNHEAPPPDTSAAGGDYRIYSYTERPLYRPGQTVYFKAILRRDLATQAGRGADGSLYQIVPNANVTLIITDSQNRQLEKEAMRTDANGDLSGQLDLAPDAAVGKYSMEFDLTPPEGGDPVPFYNRFTVAEYRKPEYEVTVTPRLDKSYAVQGQPFDVLVSARYYSGGPVAKAKLELAGDDTESTVLDANGAAIFHEANPVDPNWQNQNSKVLNFNAKVIDAANRIVEASASVESVYTSVQLDIRPEKAAYHLKETGALDVVSTDPTGAPVSAGVRIQAFYYLSERVKDPETLRWGDLEQKISFCDQTVTTNSYGRATLQVPLHHAGYLDVTADAVDGLGRPADAECNIWCLSRDQQDWGNYDFSTLEVVPDQDTYQPGATVRALITCDKTSGVALATLQSDRVFWHQVVPLAGHVTEITFPFPKDAAPGATLSVGYCDGNNWDEGTAYLRALAPSQLLKVAITPDKTTYRPGDTVHYRIAVRDGEGRPCRTDLSVGIVDKSIYALANDETPDPVSFFYDNRPNLVATTWDFPGEVAGGAYQRIQKTVPVRKDFRDTAFWNPIVTTGADGNAILDVPLPDNLTTWRATVRGITASTQVGTGQNEVLVTKSLLTRLILPRTLVQTDRVQVQVIVQNNTKKTVPVMVSLRGTGIDAQPLPALDPGTALGAGGTQPFLTGQLEAGASRSFWWEIGTDNYVPGGRVTLTATARDADDPNNLENADAQELPLPVRPRAVATSDSFSGSISAEQPESKFTLKAPAGAVPGAGQLEITLAPSVAGPMLDSLEGLIQYPFGCTEQTLSRFVPALAATQTYKELKLPAPEVAAQMPKIFAASRDTLYNYQHADGGWGCWQDDDTDPFLTAYALYGLTLAHEAGYDVDRAKVRSGMVSLLAQFGNSNLGPDGRAYLVMVFATAQGDWKFTPQELGTSDDFPEAVYGVRDRLTPYGLANLALAELKLGHPLNADDLLDRLEKEAHYEDSEGGQVVLWDTPESEAGSWLDAPLETTAYALQALLAGRPNSPAILPAVRRLLRSRNDEGWESTRETAQIVMALCQYLKRTQELRPNETVEVWLGNQKLRTIALGPADLNRVVPSIFVNPCDGDAAITIRRTGTGSVYFAAELKNYETATLDSEVINGMRVERHYQLRNAKGWWRDIDGPIPCGATVRVDLRLHVFQPMNFVMLENPAPAGFEARPEDDDLARIVERHADCIADAMVTTDPPPSYQDLPVTRRDEHDGGQTFFMDSIGKGDYYLRYVLRPEQVGQLTALPATATTVYHPSLNAQSPAAALEVK